MTRTISIVSLAAVLIGCATAQVAPPDSAAVCEAMRPAFPVTYHGNTDGADTIKGIRAANARFAAACK